MVNIAPSSLHGNGKDSQCHASSKEVVIDAPTEKDILLGRGAGCWSHPGNRLFRDLINDALPHCQRSDTRTRKSEIFTMIYESILSKNGRFIKYNHKTKRWHQADKRQALEKISHAIRDRRACLTRENSNIEKVFSHHDKDNTRSDSSGNAFIKNLSLYPSANATEFSDQISNLTNKAISSPPIETNDSINPLQSKFIRNSYPLPLPFPIYQRKIWAPFTNSGCVGQMTEYHYRMISQRKAWNLLQEIKSMQTNLRPLSTSDVNSSCKTQHGFRNFHFIGNNLMIETSTTSLIEKYAQTQIDSKSRASINEKNDNYLMTLATLSTLIQSVN
jgi:hypothetical protein